MTEMPRAVAALVDDLMMMPGAVAVALGGSRAGGSCDEQSDWDLGVYYRGALDLTALAAYGPVHPPGSWGRLMNGGAWLRAEGMRVDVLLRDLDAVDYWHRRTERGEFEIDALLGYVAGVPTYLLDAELASCQVLRGALPRPSFPESLRAAAPARWRFSQSFSLEYARMHARRGNIVGVAAQTAKAVMEAAHAIVSERGRWVCNEKRLIDEAGLARVQASFVAFPQEPARLLAWVEAVARQLEA